MDVEALRQQVELWGHGSLLGQIEQQNFGIGALLER
jgi:hypothetical protein